MITINSGGLKPLNHSYAIPSANDTVYLVNYVSLWFHPHFMYEILLVGMLSGKPLAIGFTKSIHILLCGLLPAIYYLEK